ncbi:hypothetical protein [Nocardioides sp. T2.26MG-1]|uniref:hypothetical protein n=1 Tax=Nocardioides sp. T2.26MG-1 TaxID=3041166 RepID=UPI002540D454|nr:hypothetical protein [Nocardioides sp. T2.26MG-1]
MRRILGTTILLTALALPVGCGSDDAGAGRGDRTPSAVDPCDEGAGDCYVAPTLVSGTAGGGEVSRRATELDDAAAVAAYVAEFSDSFAAKVTRAAGRVVIPEGNTLVAAVVSIGCDVPPGADVTRAGGGIEITPQKVPSPMKECLAPVTTVALAPVPATS